MSAYGNDSKESWGYIKKILKDKLIIASSPSVRFKSVESDEYVVGVTCEDGVATLMKLGA